MTQSTYLKACEFPFQLQAASDWSGVRREVDVASHNVRQLGSLLFEMEVTIYELTVIPVQCFLDMLVCGRWC